MFRNEHHSNEMQKREEVLAAINKLKEKHASALLTVEYLEAIYEMGEEDDDNTPYEAQ